MSTIIKNYIYIFILFLLLLFYACENNNPKQIVRVNDLYAEEVIRSNITCKEVNKYTDPSESLGPPNAFALPPKSRNYYGFVSLGIDGAILLKMAMTIADGPGADIRIYQSVFNEPIEVWVSPSIRDRFVSLGIKNCGGNGTPFNQYCEFDLEKSGYKSIQYILIEDKQKTQAPNIDCYESAGADIDAVQGLYIYS